jgi:predicted Fe-Mo cluster-binding NifX family protein
MKVAITIQGEELSSPIDPRFGRAAGFLVVDTETSKFSYIENKQNLQAAQGAGIQTGKAVVELGVDAVLTGHVGPKAFATLSAGGIAIYTGIRGTACDALDQLKAGTLELSSGADVEGHWV